MTSGAVIDWSHVKQDNKSNEETNCRDEADHDADNFSSPFQLVEVYVRQEGEWEEEAKHEAYEMCIIVNVRQQAKDEEHHEDDDELAKCPGGFLQDVPVLYDLHEQGSHDAKLGTCRSRLK